VRRSQTVEGVRTPQLLETGLLHELGSSPSHYKSVDFLHSATLVISQARLPPYTYYSKIDFTHKLDRTTVTVGALSIEIGNINKPDFCGRLFFSMGYY
jgi:hypothetical protein